jgi:uncharacterized membrane protein
MTRLFTASAVAAVVFLAMDLSWLSLMSARLYKPVIGDLMSGKVEIAPALLFYLLYLGGLGFFAIWPGVRDGDVGKAVFSAAMLGLVAYGTYDLTNQATLKVWAWKLTLADMAWGAAASATATFAGMMAARLLNR